MFVWIPVMITVPISRAPRITSRSVPEAPYRSLFRIARHRLCAAERRSDDCQSIPRGHLRQVFDVRLPPRRQPAGVRDRLSYLPEKAVKPHRSRMCSGGPVPWELIVSTSAKLFPNLVPVVANDAGPTQLRHRNRGREAVKGMLDRPLVPDFKPESDQQHAPLRRSRSCTCSSWPGWLDTPGPGRGPQAAR